MYKVVAEEFKGGGGGELSGEGEAGCSLALGTGPPLLQCICKTYMDLAHYIHFLCTSSRLCLNSESMLT